MTDTPAAMNPEDQEIFAGVQQLFDDTINPALQSHGGFANLVKVENRHVYVELGGGCRGCPGARQTMRMGVEALIRERVPHAGEVFDVTDHS